MSTPNTFTTFLETQLNDQQRQAVTPKDGVFLVCAGAGSGKTRVITARITNLLLNENVAPNAIVALTFTNKAAREMQERVQKFLGQERGIPFVGTFHAYCLRLLKTYGLGSEHKTAGTQPFSLMDEDDQEKLVRSLIKKFALEKKVTHKHVLSSLSLFKNDIVSLKDLDPNKITDPLLRQFFVAYEQEKRAAHCLDFDDLIIEALRLITTNKQCRQTLQTMIKHVLVDEYQDTNRIQHALIKALTINDHGERSVDSLCVVGDEDQSIYSWRGATVSNMLQFAKDFPGVQRVTINQNYRSVCQILDVANAVISNNTERNPKHLWSDRTGTNRVRILSCMTPYQESTLIALYAQILHKRNECQKLAVLYRSHYQSRLVEEALIRLSVPYKVIGGIQFYERQEIKDIMAYLRLANNPYDRLAFTRSINVPHRGLGEKFIETAMSTWAQQPFSDVHAIGKELIEKELVTGIRKQALEDYLATITALEQCTSAQAAVEVVIEETQFFAHIKSSYDTEEARARSENIHELLSALVGLQERGIITVRAFLEEVALLQEHIADAKATKNCIQLMTLHSAKGLEFDTIFITGLEEGILPSNHALYQPETLEEERRLLYVGITRARERILITQCEQRTIYGQLSYQQSSRFVKEIPEGLALTYDCTTWDQISCLTNVQNWLSGTARPSSSASSDSEPPRERDPFDLDLPFLKQDSYKPSFMSKPQSTSAITPALHTPLPLRKSTWNTSIRNVSSVPTPTTAASAPRVSKDNLAMWKKHQPVKHAVFGTGIIEQIEEQDGQATRLTIRFKQGLKKIAASFVERA